MGSVECVCIFSPSLDCRADPGRGRVGADIPDLPTGRPAADAAELGRGGCRLPRSFLVLAETQPPPLQNLPGGHVQWGPSGGDAPPSRRPQRHCLLQTPTQMRPSLPPCFSLPLVRGVRLEGVSETGLETGEQDTAGKERGPSGGKRK